MVIYLVFFCGTAAAETAIDLEQTLRGKTLHFPYRLVLHDAFGQIIHVALHEKGYLPDLDTRTLAANVLLNRFNPLFPKETSNALRKIAPVDSIIERSQTEWKLVSLVAKQARSAPAPVTDTPEGVYSWLFGTLGYDGIIVASAPDRVVIASNDILLKSAKQAVVIADSKDKFFLDGGKRRGSAILAYTGSAGIGLGYFRILLGGTTRGRWDQLGTKVTFSSGTVRQ